MKSTDGEVKLVWSNDPKSIKKNGDSIPLFSASELAPTYHDGGINRKGWNVVQTYNHLIFILAD